MVRKTLKRVHPNLRKGMYINIDSALAHVFYVTLEPGT